MLRRLALTSVLVTLATAGCGGTSRVYDGATVLSKARAQAHVKSPAEDFISSKAPTSFDFVLPNGDSGTVAVWGTVGKAQAELTAYHTIAGAFGAHAHLEQHGNVTIAWGQAPDGSDESAVAAMLTSKQAAKVTSTTTSSSAHPSKTALIFNRQIGTVRIGESATQVVYEFGDGKIDGCVTMYEDTSGQCDYRVDGPIRHYKVPGGGYLRVGFSDQRVVFIETTSRRYRTTDGIGVGTKIPFAKHRTMDGVRFRLFAPSYGGTSWIGYSKLVPYPKNGQSGNAAERQWVKVVRHTAFTVLNIGGGVVNDVVITRGDNDLQF